MAPTIWFNPRQPQTLYLSQMLMYMRGGIAILFGALLSVGRLSLLGSTIIGTIWLLLLTVGMVVGAVGIANEKRWGYRLGVIAAFTPFLVRLIVLADSGPFDAFYDPIKLMFDIALVALLLHPTSVEYQKVWFR